MNRFNSFPPVGSFRSVSLNSRPWKLEEKISAAATAHSLFMDREYRVNVLLRREALQDQSLIVSTAIGFQTGRPPPSSLLGSFNNFENIQVLYIPFETSIGGSKKKSFEITNH